MAYNVFKRPMFKRGGSTTGTGIMSHVEPRRNFQVGGPGFTLVGQPYTPGGSVNPMNLPMDPSKLSGRERGELARNRMMYNLKRFGRGSLDFLKGAGQRTAGFIGLGNMRLPGMPTIPAGATTAAGTAGVLSLPIAVGGGMMYMNKPKTLEELEYIKSMNDSGVFDETAGPGDYEEFMKTRKELAKDPEGTRIGFFDIFKDPETIRKEKAEQAAVEEVNKDKKPGGPTPGPGTKDPKYTETDLKTGIKKEAEVLKELLGPAVSDAEKAFLISKALKTPGSLSDKIEVATDEGRKLAAKKSTQDRAAILTAYKYAKEKDLYQSKPSEAQKMIEGYVSTALKDPKNTKSGNELRQEAYQKYFGNQTKETNAKILSSEKEAEIYQNELDVLDKLQKKINNKEKLSEGEMRKYRRALFYKKRYEDAAKMFDVPLGGGFAKGGRVNFANGSVEEQIQQNRMDKIIPQAEDMQAMDVAATEVKEDAQSVPMKPVQKISYQELRSRLPKEVTNDIVQLLSSSEEALQDFAYIQTQTDINAFNQKYGVNLLLPPGVVQ